MKRTTITLTDDQQRALAAFARPGAYQDAVRAWAAQRGIQLGGSPAEAALVRVLIDAGIDHFRDQSADLVYRELAVVYQEEGLAGEIDVLRADSLDAGRQVEA